MVTKPQAATGGAVVGVASVIAGVLVGGLTEGMPNYSLLILETNYKNIYPSNDNNLSQGLIGRNYGWYLVGTYGVEEDKSKNNKDWWEWSFKNLKNDPKEGLTQDFQNITSAYADENSSDNALNKACEKVYKKPSNSVYFISSSAKPDAFKLGQNLLRYCSPMGQKPLSILLADNGIYKDSTIYATNGNRNDDLASVHYKGNNVFWKLKNNEFFGKDDEDGVGKNIQESDSKLLYALYKKRESTDRGTIKDTCGKIYITKESPETTEKFEFFKNHCSLRSY